MLLSIVLLVTERARKILHIPARSRNRCILSYRQQFGIGGVCFLLSPSEMRRHKAAQAGQAGWSRINCIYHGPCAPSCHQVVLYNLIDCSMYIFQIQIISPWSAVDESLL
jgi:hypothetical protein